MTVPIDTLQQELRGRTLPGGRIVIEPHEAFIADAAIGADQDPDGAAHPVWFVFASLRCMGISVEELCALARQAEGDTLLLGNCRVEQLRTLRPGRTYLAFARIGQVESRTTRDGSRLDAVEVIVELHEDGAVAEEAEVGEIVSTYLFKRGTAA